LGAADAWRDAEIDLRLAKLGGLGGDDEVALIASSQPPPRV